MNLRKNTEASEERNIELISLRVANPQEIGKLNDLIHDEYAEADDIEYNRQQGIVKIPYRRIFHNGPRKTIHNWLFYLVKEVDVIRSEIRIHHVEEFKVNDPDQIGSFSFTAVNYNQDTSTLLFYTNSNIGLSMKVSKLLIEIQDLEIRGKSRINFFLFAEVTNGRVYD